MQPQPIEIPLKVKLVITIGTFISILIYFFIIICFNAPEQLYDSNYISYRYSNEKSISFFYGFIYLILGMGTCSIGIYALDEKSYHVCSLYWICFFSSLMFEISIIQIIIFEWDIFEVLDSIFKWLIFIIVFIVFRYTLYWAKQSDQPKTKKKKIKKSKDEEKVIQLDQGYIVKLDDGSQIFVHKEELYINKID